MSVDIEVGIKCTECREDLVAEIVQTRYRQIIKIKPCEACIDAAKNEGFTDGVRECKEAMEEYDEV